MRKYRECCICKTYSKNKAEQPFADNTQSETVSQVAENFLTERDLKTIWNVANEIRKTLLGSKWKFEGDMNNYETPNLLQTFLKWVKKKEKGCQI